MLQLFLERKILSTLSRYCSAPPPSLVQLCLINDFDDDDDDDDNDNDNDDDDCAGTSNAYDFMLRASV